MSQPAPANDAQPLRVERLRDEVLRVTASLMFLLEGMEAVRDLRRGSFPVPASSEPSRTGRTYPLLQEMNVPLAMGGDLSALEHALGRGGSVEQLAYRGWLEAICRSVENHQAEGVAAGQRAADLPAPLLDILRIRLDLLNHQGLASEQRAGRCRVLTWFQVDEPILFCMRHVLDFLNQLGWMSGAPASLGPRLTARWMPRPEVAALQDEAPAPEIISMRCSKVRRGHDGGTRATVSLVFANGVFADLPVDLAAGWRSLSRQASWAQQTRIDESGDLRFPDGSRIPLERLYRDALRAIREGTAISHTPLANGSTAHFDTDDSA